MRDPPARNSSRGRSTPDDDVLAACTAGSSSLICEFLDANDYPKSVLLSLLEEACAHGYVEIVDLILTRHPAVDIDHWMIRKACWHGVEICKYIEGRWPGRLANTFFEVNGSPVQIAITTGNTELLDYLLSKGADPGRSDRSDRWWHHYLAIEHCALSVSSVPAMARLLVQHGAMKSGTKALHIAAFQGNIAMIHCLLEEGFDVNELDTQGDLAQRAFNRTPLHQAVESGHADAAEYLLDHGAYPSARDSTGKTAYELATELQNDDVLDVFRWYAADYK